MSGGVGAIQVVGCRVSIVSRSSGKSAVGASAYRSGILLFNEYDGMLHDYTRKKGVIYTEILLPAHAPDWMKDQSELWNSIEKVEPRKDAQLAREYQIDLPLIFTAEQNIALTKKFAQDFVDDGMVADIAIHQPNRYNPNNHAHILLTMRPITPEGEWGAKSINQHVLDENGEKIKLPNGNYKSKKVKTTDWDSKDNVEKGRERLAVITNEYLEMYGYDKQLTHLSYERQGLDQVPTVRLSRIDWEREQRGERTARGDLNRRIREENRQREALKAEIAELKRQQAELEKESEPEPHHEVEFEDRYRRPTPPSYKERYLEATKKRVVRGSNSHRQFTTLAQEGRRRDRENMDLPTPQPKPHHKAKFEDRYKPQREPTPHQEVDSADPQKSSSHNERQEQTPEPKPHHKVDFADRFKVLPTPKPKQEKTDHERQQQEQKNKDNIHEPDR